MRAGLERDPERCARGPGAALHAILDQVVDDYMPAIEGLENDIEEVEEEVFSERRMNLAERIYRSSARCSSSGGRWRRSSSPSRGLAGGHYKSIHPDTRAYFRDVRDHLARAHEQLDGLRDLLASSSRPTSRR